MSQPLLVSLRLQPSPIAIEPSERVCVCVCAKSAHITRVAVGGNAKLDSSFAAMIQHAVRPGLTCWLLLLTVCSGLQWLMLCSTVL